MTRYVFAASVGVALSVTLIVGQQPTPVYSAEQASAGRAAYQTSCASCHMADLAGRNEAPALAGVNFMNTWRSRSTRDLFEFIQGTMPPAGASLSSDQYAAVVAYILQSNGAAAGNDKRSLRPDVQVKVRA